MRNNKKCVKLFAVVLAMCFMFCGCGKNATQNIEPEQQLQPVEEVIEVVVEVDELTEPEVDNTETPTEAIEEPAETIETTTEVVEEIIEPTVESTVENTEPVIEPTAPPMDLKDDELVEISSYIPNAIIDLKYATTDNFTGEQIYDSDMPAMLRFGTVKKLMKVQEELNTLGYTLVVWDAYRPTSAQFKLWEVCPNPTYVANPNGGGSSHSSGNTLDITIQTLNGEYVEMPTGFDDFSKLADRNYGDVSEDAGNNATMLEELMEKYGFKPYSGEWWHFSDTTQYDIVQES